MTRSTASSSEPETGGRALPLVLLAGPTASGKTSLSLRLARALSTEIVNADSMQVYRHMDIGTAKPSPSERAMVKHHLLDVADPDEPFDAASYLERARPVVESLLGRGKAPLVVGGTGLYMKVLTRGICSGPPADRATKEKLLDEEKQYGLARLYEELSRADAQGASRIHPHDRQRIFRALEVFRLTGEPLSVFQERHRFRDAVFPAIKVFLFREREELYGRIDRRVDLMLENGFKEEVRKLFEMGYGPELKPLQSLGYRQMAQHLLGEASLEQAVCLIKRDTRRYAKRQLTWFRADAEFRWFHAEDFEGVFSFISGELKKRRGETDVG